MATTVKLKTDSCHKNWNYFQLLTPFWHGGRQINPYKLQPTAEFHTHQIWRESVDVSGETATEQWRSTADSRQQTADVAAVESSAPAMSEWLRMPGTVPESQLFCCIQSRCRHPALWQAINPLPITLLLLVLWLWRVKSISINQSVRDFYSSPSNTDSC